MATNISRIFDATLNIQSGSTAPANVSIPAIITNEVPLAGFGASNRAKLYTIGELSTVADDFTSGTSGATYKAAAALAAVTPRVKSFYVIKRTTTVAAVWTLVFDANIVTGNTIAGTINGEAISVPFNTSNAQSLTDLATAIQALGMVATAVSNGSTTITITFELEAEPEVSAFTVTGGASQANCTETETTPATNIVDDINLAIAEASTNLWYLLLPTTTDQWAIEAAADLLETLDDRKMMLAVSTAAAIYTAGSTDIASRLNANSYRRTGIIYHDDSTEYIHCRWASKALAAPPGTVQFGHSAAGKNLTGATAAPLTSSQVAIAQGKKANVYTLIANGLNLFGLGVACDGNPLESVRDIDYLMNVLEATIASRLTSRNKTPFNETGRQLIQSWGNGVVQQFTGTILDPDLVNEWVVPAVSDVSAGDKAARLYSGCVLNGNYLNGIIKISATVNISI